MTTASWSQGVQSTATAARREKLVVTGFPRFHQQNNAKAGCGGVWHYKYAKSLLSEAVQRYRSSSKKRRQTASATRTPTTTTPPYHPAGRQPTNTADGNTRRRADGNDATIPSRTGRQPTNTCIVAEARLVNNNGCSESFCC